MPIVSFTPNPLLVEDSLKFINPMNFVLVLGSWKQYLALVTQPKTLATTVTPLGKCAVLLDVG